MPIYVFISNFKHNTFKIINSLFYTRKTEWVWEENSGCGKKTEWVWEENSGCGKKTVDVVRKQWMQEGNRDYRVGVGRKQWVW